MALTYEQIDNIKEGDTLLLAVIMEKKINHCTFKVKTSNDSCVAASTIRLFLPSEHGTSVPTTKHDPTRPFKGGDKVKRRTVDGRTDIDVVDNGVLTVTSDEDSHGNVRVKEPSGRSIVTKSVFLQLVTPVEEIEPYYVDYITTDDDDELLDNPRWCVKDRKYDDIVRIFYRNGFEHPKKTQAAAEAECDRLNEEYRKEHEND